MTELEQQLSAALEAFSQQYSSDVSILSQQMQDLSQRLDSLTVTLNRRMAASEAQFNHVAKLLNDFSDQLENL